MQDTQKARDLFSIQDSVTINTPVDSDNIFYVDFTPYRSDFTDKKIFRHLNIDIENNGCRSLNSSKKIFLSGYRGTGKTSELLTLKKKIDATKCYLSIFVDISEEELDTVNIETVDILILMLEKLIDTLLEKGADVSDDIISDFYEWYKTKIVQEVNKSVKGSAQIEVELKAMLPIPLFAKLIGNTKLKLQSSLESKTIIRREINNNFKTFSSKFNEFIRSVIQELKEKNHYQDLLFIVDGFEKIGSLSARKKILIDDSNKLTIIESHMLITLPIELFSQKNVLNHFSITENFPLINLDEPKAKECFKEFILKRVDEKLFASGAIDLIVQNGAGHPRQTLQIINRACLETDTLLDTKSIEIALKSMGRELLAGVDEDGLRVLNEIDNNRDVVENDTYTTLKAANIIFEYGDDSSKINPILLKNDKFQRLLTQIRENEQD